MIIKSERVATSASRTRLANHLFRGQENSAIVALRGSERDLADLFRDARQHGARYGVRHWIIAPLQPATREQVFCIVDSLAGEFRFDASRAIVIEHAKERATEEAFSQHWHLCVGEVNPADGKVLSSSHDHQRHEYVARLSEATLGHTFQLGAHHRSVLARLRREGNNAIADALEASFPANADEEPPREAFTHRDHQMLKRDGIDLPAIRATVKAAWNATTDADSLRAALRQSGLSLMAGEKPGEWVIEADGRFIGSLRRLSGARKADITRRMETGNDSTIERSPDGSSDDPRGHEVVASGRGGAKGGSVVADDSPAGSGGLVSRNHDAHIVGDPGRDRPIAGERRSAERSGGGSEARSSTPGSSERKGLIQQLRDLIDRLQSEARRAQELAISPSLRAESCLEAAEHSARARIERARIEADASDDPVPALAAEARRDQARSDENSNGIDQILGQLEQLDHRHRYFRFLPSWLRPRYAAEKHRLQTRLAELQQYSALMQLRASSSHRKLLVAAAQQSKRKAQALERLATESARCRSVLASVSIAKKLRAFPIFAILTPPALMALAGRLERLRSDGLSAVPPGRAGARLPTHF